MAKTVQYRGTTYRLGEGVCEPEPLPDFLPQVLPAGWQELPIAPAIGRDYARIYQKHETMTVILACARYGDGKRWLHVSVSRKNQAIPSWEAMCEVKDVFIGQERTAYQVMPPRATWVNIAPGVLHLWACLDGDVTPDFTAGGQTI